jgi:hypothetical protein
MRVFLIIIPRQQVAVFLCKYLCEVMGMDNGGGSCERTWGVFA